MKHITFYDGRRYLIGRKRVGHANSYNLVATSTNEYLAQQIAAALDVAEREATPLSSFVKETNAEVAARVARLDKVGAKIADVKAKAPKKGRAA